MINVHAHQTTVCSCCWPQRAAGRWCHKNCQRPAWGNRPRRLQQPCQLAAVWMTHAAMHTSTHREISFKVFTVHQIRNWNNIENLYNIKGGREAMYNFICSQLSLTLTLRLVGIWCCQVLFLFEMKWHSHCAVKICLPYLKRFISIIAMPTFLDVNIPRAVGHCLLYFIYLSI